MLIQEFIFIFTCFAIISIVLQLIKEVIFMRIQLKSQKKYQEKSIENMADKVREVAVKNIALAIYQIRKELENGNQEKNKMD